MKFTGRNTRNNIFIKGIKECLNYNLKINNVSKLINVYVLIKIVNK